MGPLCCRALFFALLLIVCNEQCSGVESSSGLKGTQTVEVEECSATGNQKCKGQTKACLKTAVKEQCIEIEQCSQKKKESCKREQKACQKIGNKEECIEPEECSKLGKDNCTGEQQLCQKIGIKENCTEVQECSPSGNQKCKGQTKACLKTAVKEQCIEIEECSQEKKESCKREKKACQKISNKQDCIDDACMAYGKEVCGEGINCTVLENGRFKCECDEGKYFDRRAKKCLAASQNCEIEGCPYNGQCVFNEAKLTRSCICQGKHLTDDCKVKPDKQKECDDAKAKPQVQQDGTVTCECAMFEKKIDSKCEDVICLDPSFQCKLIGSNGHIARAQQQGCCQGWTNKTDSWEAPGPEEQWCKPGQIKEGDKCKSACKDGKQEKICGERQCEIYGDFFKCTCTSGEQLHGTTCIPKEKCDVEKKKQCSLKGASCSEPDGDCVCSNTQKMTKEGCRDICAAADVKGCEGKTNEECAVENGQPKCVCRKGMKRNTDGVCKLTQRTTVRFKIKARTGTYSEEHVPCALHLATIAAAIKDKVPDFDETAIRCSGEEVWFDADTDTEEAERALQKIFELCTTVQGHDGCLLGNGLYFEKESVQIAPARLCDELKYLTDNSHLVCTYDENNKTVLLCNNKTSQVVENVTSQGFLLQVCNPLPCSQICVEERKHCILQACVCKPQYRLSTTNSECESYCEIKPSVCSEGEICISGTGDQSYYCKSPANVSQTMINNESTLLQSAKRNIVIVSAALASILLMCFVVSATIILRLKKKAQGPNRYVERRPPSELHGYEGPYTTSDPASLHKKRDHTFV